MTTPDGARARVALAARVRSVAAVLLDENPTPDDDPAREAAIGLVAITRRLGERPSDEQLWFVLAGLTATFPTRAEVDLTRRRIELAGPAGAATMLVDVAVALLADAADDPAEISVITDRVLVDVDFTARHDLHTGIQRVVRQTVPLWVREHDVLPVAWTSARAGFRALDPVESQRILAWSITRRTNEQVNAPDRVTSTDQRVLVPWRCVVALPEVPQIDVAPRLAALGACSNNTMVAIGHDAIPLLSADTLELIESEKFMNYLAAIKYAARIAGVSRSSTQEFASFGSMLSSQGLPPPTTVTVPLPIDFAVVDNSAPRSGGRRVPATTTPEVVVVGSHDTRKNHLGVLHAAETLWQDGVPFRLRFVSSGGSSSEFARRAKVLGYRGRDLVLSAGMSDAQLRQAVSSARFTVFPSLHEGYGLPVAESLALGTPVITTSYGSTAEIAAGGGALTIDPRDDAALAAAMRLLLTDDAEIARLRAQIRSRPKRSWQDYAHDLWGALVAPVLGELAGPGRAEGRGTAARRESSQV